MDCFIKKYLFLFLIFSIGNADDGWVSIQQSEPIVHQLEIEDHSIWVVFAKNFGSERVLIRFPEDPVYKQSDGRFEIVATRLGLGEFSLLTQKKSLTDRVGVFFFRNSAYYDHDAGLWVFERHIDSREHHYLLRVTDPLQNNLARQMFFDSFEIEGARSKMGQ
jgi:hypothetical protein